MNGADLTNNNSRCFFCEVSDPSALSECKDCSNVFYCSAAHLSLHRPRDTCLPFRVEHGHPLKGRILTAIRDIRPFEVVVEDLSPAYGPYESNPTTVCVVCLRITQEEEELKCGKCQLPLCADCIKLDPVNSQLSCLLYTSPSPRDS